MSTEDFGQACEGPILETLAGLPPLPRGGFPLGQMAMRPEGGDWVATSEAPGTTMRFRLTFENWPGSIRFTGTAAGRAADPSPPVDPIAASAEISGGPGQPAALLSGRVLRDDIGLTRGPYYAQATLTRSAGLHLHHAGRRPPDLFVGPDRLDTALDLSEPAVSSALSDVVRPGMPLPFRRS